MRRNDRFSDDRSERYDPEGRYWYFRTFGGNDQSYARWLAKEFFANALGEAILSLERLDSDEAAAARGLVVSYGRLLRIGRRRLTNTPLYREVMAELTRAWERRGLSLAREAAKELDGRVWIDQLSRLTHRAYENYRVAEWLLGQLDELELVGWALQEEPGFGEFRRKLRAARRIFSDRIELFLPAVAVAKGVAYLAGNGDTFRHDPALVATLSKFRELLLETAEIANGGERLTCARLARRLRVL